MHLIWFLKLNAENEMSLAKAKKIKSQNKQLIEQYLHRFENQQEQESVVNFESKHKSLESEVPSQQGLGNPFLANQVPVSKDKGFPISTATIITPQQADQNAQYTGKDDLREFGDYEDKNKGLQKAIKILNLKHTTGLEEPK